LRAARGAISLVPTMGALHAGHEALVRAAAASGAGVVASIFVNPTQFGPNEDLARYPRDEPGDLGKLSAWGCALAWVPDALTMYSREDATSLLPLGPAERWEGAARPGHFRGVATVVAKLIGQVRPNAAYFGEKDWQQLQVVKRMVADLFLPVDIIGVATVREDDGLALSSRNRYLTPKERAQAPLLYASLRQAAERLSAGQPTAAVLRATQLRLAGFSVDYLALVDGPSLAPIEAVEANARLIVAARLGAVRLIDNVPVTPPCARQPDTAGGERDRG
jgi:pantoate--beta-alanine ligase